MITEEFLVKLGIKFDDQGKVRTATAQFVELGKAEAGASAASKTLEQQLKETGKAAAASSRGTSSLNNSLSFLESGILRIAGPAAALALATKGLKETIGAFASFETALVGVGKTTDTSGQALHDLGDSFQRLSEKIPVAAKDLASLGQVAGALGVRGSDNLLNFAETVGKLQVATDLAGEEAAQSLKRILDVTGEGVDRVDELGSVIVRLGNNFATTESKIVRIAVDLGRGIGIFHASSDQVTALGAAMASLGVRAELGGSVVSRAFLAIDKAIRTGGDELKELTKLTGMTGEQLRKSFAEDSVGTFTKFLEGLRGVGAEGRSMALSLKRIGLEGDEVNKVLPVMATRFDKVGLALQMAAEEAKKATALNNEASRAFDTLASDATRAKNAVTNLAADIGEILAPSLRSLLKDLAGAAEGLTNFISAAKRLGAVEVVKKVSEYEDLNAEIAKLSEHRDKLFQTAELLKSLGPEPDQNKKLKGLLNIFGSLDKAMFVMDKSQADVVDQFSIVSAKIKTLTGDSNDLTNSLLDVKKAAKDIGSGGFVGPLAPPPKIQKEVDPDKQKKVLAAARRAAAAAAKQEALRVRGLEYMLKIQKESDDALLKSIEIGASSLDQIRLKGAADIAALDRLQTEVKLNKDLTASQKEAATALLQDARVREAISIKLELEKDARERVKSINDDILAQAQTFLEFGETELQTAKRKTLEQVALLKKKQDQLLLEKDINAEAVGAIEAQIELTKAVGARQVFEIQLKETSDFGQLVGKTMRDFGHEINSGISLFNEVSGTILESIEQGAAKAATFLSDTFGEAAKPFSDALVSGVALFEGVLGVQIGHLSDETIHAFALGAAKFVSSFKGVMSVSGKLIGTGITGALNYGIDGLNKALGTTFAQLPNVLGPIFEGLGSMLGSFTDGMLDVVEKMFDPEFIQGLADSLSGLVEKLPQALMKAFDALYKGLLKIMEQLPSIVDKLMDNMNVIVQKIVDALPGIIEKMMDSLGRFLDRLPEIFGRIIDALPGILNTFLENLPKVITKLFSAVGTIVAQLVKVLPETLKTLFDHLPDIIEAIILGLMDAMDKVSAALVDSFVSGGAERMVGALIRAIPKLIVAIVRGIVMGLIKSVGSIFKGVKVPDGLSSLPEKFSDGIKKLAAKVTEESSQLFKVLDLKAETRGQGLAKTIEDAVDAATTRLGERFHGLLDGLLAAWRWIYDNTIKPFLDLLKAIWDFAIAALSAVWEGVKALWEGMMAVLRAVWEVIVSVWRALWDAVQIIWQGMLALFQAAWEVVKIIWATLLKLFQGAWEIVQTIWNTMLALLTNVWGAVKIIWDSMMKILTSVWETVRSLWQVLMDLFSGKLSIMDAVRKSFAIVFESFTKALGILWDTAKKLFNNLIERFQILWNGIKKIFETYTKMLKTVFDAAGKIFDTAVKALSGVWDAAKKAFAKITKPFENLGKKIWDSFKDAFDKGVSAFTDMGANIWNGLSDGLSGIGGILTTAFQDAINGIGGMLAELNPGNLVKKIFNFEDSSGTGKVEDVLGIDIPFINFASGGRVPGTAVVGGDSLLNDRILALLSPGEAVIPRSRMDDPEVKKIVDAILDGNLKPLRLAEGGVLGQLAGALSNPFGSGPLGGAWDNLSDVAKQAFGPVAGTIADLLSPDQLSKLGEAITSGSVSLGQSSVGSIARAGDMALGEALKLYEAAGRSLSGIHQKTLKKSTDLIHDATKGLSNFDAIKALKNLDPRHLWNVAKEQGMKTVMRAFEANAFHEGGLVGGGGEVGGMLKAGEFVMSQGAVKNLGLGALTQMNRGQMPAGDTTNTFNIDINIKSDGTVDENFVRTKLMPQLKAEIKKSTQRGELLVSKRGIFE